MLLVASLLYFLQAQFIFCTDLWIPAVLNITLRTQYNDRDLSVTLENQIVYISPCCFEPEISTTHRQFLKDWQSLVAAALYDPDDLANVKAVLASLPTTKFSSLLLEFTIGGRKIEQVIEKEVVCESQNLSKISLHLQHLLFKQSLLEEKIPQREAKKSVSFGLSLLYTFLIAFMISFFFVLFNFKKIRKIGEVKRETK